MEPLSTARDIQSGRPLNKAGALRSGLPFYLLQGVIETIVVPSVTSLVVSSTNTLIV